MTGQGEEEIAMRARGLGVILATLAASPAAWGASWVATLGGAFQEPSSWSPPAVPGPGDDAVFDAAAAYTVSFAADAASRDVTVRAGDVVFDLGAHRYELGGALEIFPAEIDPGQTYAPDGSLLLADGLLVVDSFFVDGNRGSGAPGGRLSVSTDAQLVAFEMTIGSYLGLGVLEIADGGYAFTASAILGVYQCCALGVAIVDGPGSQWSVGDLVVSLDGDGDLVVQNGGLLTTTTATLSWPSDSSNGGSTAQLSGDGSAWLNGGNLTVGGGYFGELVAEGGALLVTTNLFIASGDAALFAFGPASGTVEVLGEGTLLRAWDSVVVGGSTLPGPQGGDQLGSIGRLSVAGGASIGIDDRLVLWNDSTVELSEGSLDIGSVLPNAPPGIARVREGGSLEGAGNLIGSLEVEGDVRPGGRDGAPGIDLSLLGNGTTDDKPYLLEIEGDLQLSDTAGTHIEIAADSSFGPGVGHDAVVVSGACQLGGFLDVRFDPSVWDALTPDDEFVVVRAANLGGAFSNAASGDRLEGVGGSFQVFYGPGSPLDANEVVLANFERAECNDGADNDGDGGVDVGGDAGCTSADDTSEREAGLVCDDGVDNDGDGGIDFGEDFGCDAALDASEQQASLVCDDGVDNDGDGFADFPADPGCRRASSRTERTQCQDGRNNDGDFGIDFDGGASQNGGVPILAPDPQCTAGWQNRERSPCGLGFEIVLCAPLLLRLSRSRKGGERRIR